VAYYIRLVSTPDKLNHWAINTVKLEDKLHFPGCEVIRLDESYIWIAYEEGSQDVVGYATLREIKGEKIGYLSRAAVARNHRRRGLHKRLIQVRIKMAKKLGWKGVITYTATDNVASANSLIKHGFQLYIPEYRWAGKEFLYFMKSFK
jgi:GNAT superfamily N-acetyltransferase